MESSPNITTNTVSSIPKDKDSENGVDKRPVRRAAAEIKTGWFFGCFKNLTHTGCSYVCTIN